MTRYAVSLVKEKLQEISSDRLKLWRLRTRYRCNQLRVLCLQSRHFIRMLFVEGDLIRRRAIISCDFFMHPEECALYFRIRGRPINKPDYVFKMFDKFHSVKWRLTTTGNMDGC